MAHYLWIMGALIAVLAFLANPYGPFGEFWPPAPGSPPITGSLVFWFILLNIFEAVSLAIALVLIMTSWPAKAAKPLSLRETRWGFVSLLWMLGNWWVHDSLHVHFGQDLVPLVTIEYLFHVTSMIAAAYLVFLAAKIFRK